MKRTFLKQAASLVACMAASPFALAQTDWPTKPIKVLVPYPPGGVLDPVARAVGQRLSVVLGQPIIVENRPGANTAIAAGAVVKSEPDGYNLLFTSPMGHVVHTMQKPRGYDALADFAAVAAVSRGDYLIVVHPSVPATTLPELIAYAKANPDKLSAGAGSSGNNEYMAAEMFKIATGVKFTTVPYKGSAQAVLDLLAGRTQLMITSRSLSQPHIDAGKLRLLAYTYPPADKPSAPTFAQSGLKGFEMFGSMNIVLAPRATPAPVIAKLASALQQVLEMPETKTAIAAVNQVAFYMPPQELQQKLISDSAKVAELIKEAGIKFE